MSHKQAKDIMLKRGLRFAAPNDNSPMLFSFLDQDGDLITWWVVWADEPAHEKVDTDA